MLWIFSGLQPSDHVKSFVSFKLSSFAFCENCDSIFLVKDEAGFLVISLVSCIIASCFNISAVSVWLLMPFMNCSSSLLSISLYLYFVAFTISLLFHSFAHSSDCLTS